MNFMAGETRTTSIMPVHITDGQAKIPSSHRSTHMDLRSSKTESSHPSTHMSLRSSKTESTHPSTHMSLRIQKKIAQFDRKIACFHQRRWS